jgi:hypothetical protein
MKKKKVELGKTYLGVVEDNKDPQKLGRLKIRVLDVYEELPTEDLPWASPWKDLNGNEFTVPDIGKVLIVVFEQADVYKPEFIFSDHFNTNLEKKVNSLSESDYLSMKSLLFDHRTQIYVNESEGLKIDHKYNNINIKENSVNINLKDNNRSLNLGDETANQQVILGNNFFQWFDEFITALMTPAGSTHIGGIPNPAFIATCMKYQALKKTQFLSHHINCVNNNSITTVKTTNREDDPQLGDNWISTKEENTLTTKTSENFTPVPGDKPVYDDTYKSPPMEQGVPDSVDTTSLTSKGIENSLTNQITPPAIGATSAPGLIPSKPELNSTKSNPKIERLVKFLTYKNYTVYDQENILNIVAVRNVGEEVTNTFDDDLFVFTKNEKQEWELYEYKITTVPGLVPGTEELPNNVAIMRLGQYVEQLSLGLWRDDVSHKCLKFETSAVQRNSNIKRYDYSSPTEIGNFPMAIHRSSPTSTAEYVFNYSEGTQVFRSVIEFEQFIRLCEKQVTDGEKDLFTYTLCSKSDFDKNGKLSSDMIKLNKAEKFL